jgi:NitT/TauT family transport system substrate-binding protein
VRDGDTFLPFTTDAAAGRYLRAHPAGTVVTYDRAVEEVRQ